jgi:hypothetical protein
METAGVERWSRRADGIESGDTPVFIAPVQGDRFSRAGEPLLVGRVVSGVWLQQELEFRAMRSQETKPLSGIEPNGKNLPTQEFVLVSPNVGGVRGRCLQSCCGVGKHLSQGPDLCSLWEPSSAMLGT